MDKRTGLAPNTVLKCGKDTAFIIEKEVARGASCVVYDAFYQVRGEVKPVRLKECYPYGLEIIRLATGELRAVGGDMESFEAAKSRLRQAFHEGNGLFLTKGLTNTASNMLHCFERNNTVYIPSAYLEGEPLSSHTFSRLIDCIRITKTVAHVVERIHRAGYLYLDIKPENVFILTDASGRKSTELVQLFDFDSLTEVDIFRKKETANVRLSCTPEFAALEQKMGQRCRIGYHTDVYGIGALLFYLIFGTVPHADDCVDEAVYDFRQSKYGDMRYQDTLFDRLTDFFHRTLANYYPDRYQTLEAVIEKLGELIQLSDRTIPYVISTAVSPCYDFIGRETQLVCLRKWAEEEKDRCMFLTGMGGIGKSALAHTFLTRNKANFDTVVYLYFHGSVQDMVIDDNGLQINTVEQREEERDADYFWRKLRSLKKILKEKRAILVIDNFYGEITEEFQMIQDIGWKILVLSRTLPPTKHCKHLPLRALGDRAELYRLFEQYAGEKTKEKDRIYLDRLIECVEGHTLALELIARQIKNSRLTLEEAEALTEKNGFSGMASEKVRFEKDSRTETKMVRDIISAVFSCSGKSQEKKRILKALSLFNSSGIQIKTFREMTGLTSLDEINELEAEGWLSVSMTRLLMHPVIRETVLGWKWSRLYCEDVFCIMKALCVELRLEAEREEYPPSYLKRNEDLRMDFEANENLRTWMGQYVSKKGLTGKVWEKRITQNDDRKVTDHGKVRELLGMAKAVLKSCGREERLCRTEIWKELLGTVLLAAPVDDEEYIIRHTGILLHDPACRNGYVLMRLYHKLFSVYLEQGEMEKGRELLEETRQFNCGYDHYVKAEYYDMEADYFDACLNGKYWKENERHDRRSLLRAIDHSIFHIRLATGAQSNIRRIEYTLNKANILIRSTSEKTAEIRKLLVWTRGWIEKHTQSCSKLRWEYLMSAAWYYTLAEPKAWQAEHFCQQAEKIVRRTCATQLEYIDIIVIPYANMMAELMQLEKAAEILEKGIKICEQYPEILPYVRKRVELVRYIQEVRGS